MSVHVIITGSSTGIGLATAKHLADNGYIVHAGIRKDSDAEALMHERIDTFIVDVSLKDSMQAAAQSLNEKLRTAKAVHLINNAGVAVPGPMEGLTDQQLREQFDVNFFGLFEWTRLCLPHIRRTKGRIVNISSVAGLVATPFLGAYCSSKYALEAATDALRRELLPAGVKVILLEPGPIKTPIWQKGLGNKQEQVRGLSPENLEFYGRAIDRFAQQIEVTQKLAISVDKVTAVVLRVLTQTSPPVRQIVASLPVKLQTRLLQVLPAKWTDRLVKRVFNK